MAIEITFGGTCRDVTLLPEKDAELRDFFMTNVAPALWEDFSKNVATARTANGTRQVNVVMTDRGCEVGGSIIIRL